MQIREVGGRVTLVRIAPDPTGRYKRQSIIGTFRRDGDIVPKSVFAKLTADERNRLKLWLSADTSRQSLAAHRETFNKAGNQIDVLITALDEAAEFLNPSEADALWQRLAKLSRALSRAGFDKPKRAVKPKSALSKQIDLLDE